MYGAEERTSVHGTGANVLSLSGLTSQSINFPALPTKTYGDADFLPGASASSGLVVSYASDNPSVATIVSGKIHIVGAGTVNITASQTGNGTYSAATPVTQVLTVNKKTVTVTAANKSRIYGASDPIYTFTYTGFITGENSSFLDVLPTGTTTTTVTSSAGNYPIMGGGASDNNYTFSYVNGTLTITKATLTVTANNASREYGDSNPVFSVTYSGFLNGDDVSVLDTKPVASSAATLTSNVGTYNITPSGGADNNYTFSYVNGTLTIVKAMVVATADNKTKIYGSSNPAFTITYTGLKNGQSSSSIGTKPTITTTATTTSDVGIYPITLSGGSATNYNLTLVDGTLTIVQKELKVTAANKTRVYNVANPALTFTYSGFITGQNQTALTQEPTISTSATISSSVGSYPIVLSGGIATNYYFTYISGTLTITKASQTITFGSLPAKNFGDAPFAITATGGASGNPVTFTSTNLSLATVSGNIVTIVGAGTDTIIAYQAGNENYSDATLKKQRLVINKINQTITFPDLPAIPFNSPDIDPGAYSSSGLPITYISTNTNIATIVNGKIHVVGVGQTFIIAYQYGNKNYNEALSVSQLVDVGKANQIISFSGDITKTFGDPDFNPGATSTSGLPVVYNVSDPSVAKLSFEGIQIVGAGSTTITATQAGNELYNAASASVTLTVNKADQAISFSPYPDITFDYPDFDPGATSSSYLGVVYSTDNPAVATVVNNHIHIVSTGSVKIIASQPGNFNYKAALDVVQPLVITKAPQTISFDYLSSHQYGDSDFDPKATSSSGLPITYTSSNPSVATIVAGKIHITGIGSTTITATQPGNTNYEAAANVQQLLNVSKASQSISFTSIPEKAIGQADFTLSATASSGLGVTYTCDNPGVATVSGGVVHIAGTGVANIKASQAGNSFYQAASDIVQKLIVKNSSQTLTFDALPAKTYGDADFTISATSSSGLPVTFLSDNTAVATVTNNSVHIVGAGTVNIYALQVGDEEYAAATPVSQMLTVNKLSQTITFLPLSGKTIADLPFTPNATSSSGLGVEFSSGNPAVAIVVANKIYIQGVGSTVITAHQGGNGNYLAASDVTQVLTVVKATQSITFGSIAPRKFGDADFDPNATASSGLPVSYSSSNTLVAAIVNGKVHIVAAGNCIITASQSGDDNYYAAGSRSQFLTVNKALQTIEFSPIPSVNYNCPDFSLNATASSGLPVTYSSDNPGIASVTPAGLIHVTNAGSAMITVSQNGNSNYNAALSVSQVLVVNKLNQIIVFDSITEKTYGDPDFDAGAISSSGLPVSLSSDNSKVAVLKNGKIHIVGAGTANILARQTGNANYNPAESDITRTLKVNKATLTVSPVNITRKYLEANPVFTFKILGFVNGETSAVIDNLPVVTTTATISSEPGIYDLSASGGADDNYNFTYQKGMMVILSTTPLKPSRPSGKTVLCVNPSNQEYTTEGAIFASSYIWSLSPASAGQISGTGKTLTVNFNDDFKGRAAIAVKAKNYLGTGESSDSLYIDILPVPQVPDIAMRGVYCSSNSFGDSINIKNSQLAYQYRLWKDGEAYADMVTGNGQRIGWGDLKAGTYSITEEVCNKTLADALTIREVDPLSVKPRLVLKWNDVIVCLNLGDSIEKYQWYKDGELLSSEVKQFIWTQKQEGYYYVKTTDLNSCVFTSDSLWIDKPVTGVIYPNPNQGRFNISFTSSEKGSITIRITNLNSSPVKMMTFDKSDEVFEKEINIPELSAGIYYIDVLLNGKRVFYDKFIRQ